MASPSTRSKYDRILALALSLLVPTLLLVGLVLALPGILVAAGALDGMSGPEPWLAWLLGGAFVLVVGTAPLVYALVRIQLARRDH